MVSSAISAIQNCGITVHNNDSLLVECNCWGNACVMMGQSKSTLVEHKTTLLKTECEGTSYFLRWEGVFFPRREPSQDPVNNLK